jgi:hypothetical protein
MTHKIFVLSGLACLATFVAPLAFADDVRSETTVPADVETTPVAIEPDVSLLDAALGCDGDCPTALSTEDLTDTRGQGAGGAILPILPFNKDGSGPFSAFAGAGAADPGKPTLGDAFAAVFNAAQLAAESGAPRVQTVTQVTRPN